MIKNLIFDCGGVVFEVDYERSFNEFKKLSKNTEKFEQLSVFGFKHIASDYEMGKQSTEDFLSYIKAKLDLQATNQQIIDAWNAMLIGFLPESVDFIKKLKNTFKIALFSNTNEIHYNTFSPICKELLALFDLTYFSHHIGFKKPNIDSFQYVLKDSGYLANETLFIDDSAENIESAKLLGIHSVHYTKDWNFERLSDYLMKL